MSPAVQPVFTESQSFMRHWWGLFVLTLVPALLPGLVQLGHAKATPTAAIWLAPLVVLAAAGLVLSLRLELRLDAAGVHYRYAPLHRRWRLRPWSEISRAYVRSYDPLGEYGGWGIKGRRCNRALNVAGGDGIQLELADGTRLLLGTQCPAEARRALQQLVQLTPPAAA